MVLPDSVMEACKFNSISTFLLRLKSDGTNLKAILHFLMLMLILDILLPKCLLLLCVWYVKLEDSKNLIMQ